MTALTDLLAELGLVEDSAVDGCESEERDRDGQWHRCTEAGDHTGNHQNEYVGSWPLDDSDAPPKVRRCWVTAPGTLEDLAAVIEAHYATELDRLRGAAKHPHKGPNDTDVSMLRAAAGRVRGGYPAGGSNTQQMVARVLVVVADALDTPTEGEKS